MEFAYSDLAAECGAKQGEGVCVRHADAKECAITYVRIDSAEAAARIGLYTDGFHFSAALVCAVAGIDIHVQGPQAKGAMVTGCVT